MDVNIDGNELIVVRNLEEKPPYVLVGFNDGEPFLYRMELSPITTEWVFMGETLPSLLAIESKISDYIISKDL